MKAKKTLALVAIALLGLTTTASAQGDEVEASVEANLVSKYLWRGLEKGGVSLQPAVSVGWQGLFLKASGSVGLSKDDGEEIDLELGYRLAGFNIGVVDYWHTGIDVEDRYLQFDRDEGPHRMEANLGYTCRYFGLQAYTTFWGKDQKRGGDRAYSTYIEAMVPFRLGGLSWLVKGGMTPFESSSQKRVKTAQTLLGIEKIYVDDYLYADGPACVLASVRATKQFSLGEVKMPVFAEVQVNPYLQQAHVVLGLSVIPF